MWLCAGPGGLPGSAPAVVLKSVLNMSGKLVEYNIIFIFLGIDLSVYVLYLSLPSHALTFIAYVCCLHMFKCCVVCKFNMI